MIVEPEKGLNAKQEAKLEQKLAAYKAGLTDAEVEQLIGRYEASEGISGDPGLRREDLEKIPMLSRNDIRREAAPLYNKAGEVEGVPVIHQDIFSNGIVYLGLLLMSRIFRQRIPRISHS